MCTERIKLHRLIALAPLPLMVLSEVESVQGREPAETGRRDRLLG